ncbi:tetratricopeptide repeat protein [Paraburkholderia sp. PREW-6R]|uniref:tetratricopeptide repeat protein n=1 Tax=Paraburkholderia sp. PREW-6R TaxID=3141544 RepID=UPI0031F4A743
MKPSSGRARSAATLAATALSAACGGTGAGVRTGMSSPVKQDVRRSLAAGLKGFTRPTCVSLALALAVMTAGPAFAQKAANMPQGPAVRDNTPEIDASIEQRNWQASLTQLDARIASNPRDAQAKFKRGTVLAHLNRDDEAIAAFTELTQLYPELPEPYNNLAALYAKHGRYDEARAALETATRVNPNYGLAYENLGDLYLRLADEAYRRAQGMGKASATTTQRLADIQKIITPAAARPAVKKASTTPDESTQRSMPNMTQTPSFQYGGANGSLAMPPYMAPSK